GVDIVIGAVDQRHFEVDDGKTRQHAGPKHGFETLLDSGNVLLRHGAADDFVFKHKAARRGQRFSDDLDASELPGPASLLLVGIVDGDRLADLLAIGHLRRADIGVDLVGPFEDVDLNIEVQLAHAFENGLPRFLVGGDAERGVLGYELGEGNAEFLLI